MTIFAPSDTAFDSLTEDEKKALIDNKQTFSGKYHFFFLSYTFKNCTFKILTSACYTELS